MINFLKISITLLFILLQSPAHAQAITADMKTALQSLVASQNLVQNWPLIVRNARISGESNVKNGALRALENNARLSPEQLEKAKILVEELAPQIADDVDKSNQRLDSVQLMQSMVESVYPKYYSVSEIQELADFYKSIAFQKTVSISLAVTEESRRTGKDANVLWAMYSSKLSLQEKKYLENFQNSIIGRKQKSLTANVNSDSFNYLKNQFDSGIDDIVGKYAKILSKRILEK